MNLSAGVQYQFVFDPADGTQGDISLGLYGPKAAKPAFTYGTRADSLAGSDVWGMSLPGWGPGEGIETFVFTPAVTGNYLLYAYQKSPTSAAGTIRFFPTSLLGGGTVPGRPAPSGGVALPARTGRPCLPLRVGRGRHRAARHRGRGRTVATAYRGALPAGPVGGVGRRAGRRDGGRPGLYFARLTTTNAAAVPG